MDLTEIFGLATVLFNVIVLIGIIPSLIAVRRREPFHLQFHILLLAILLLLPVITFENVLFLDLNYGVFNFSYSESFMKFTFLLGIIAYFVYNLHLLTIEDFPTYAVSFIAIFTGFAIGAMITGAQLDVELIATPIYYSPAYSGKLFILSLMLFNLVGGIGFLISLYFKKYRSATHNVSKLEMFAIFNFFISPAIIFALRFGGIRFLPFNFIFLQPEIAFSIHIFNYLFYPEKSGYPSHVDIVSLNLIDRETGTVIASYSPIDKDEKSKLGGMAMIAIDQIVSMFSNGNDHSSNGYVGTYGDIIFIRKQNHIISAIFAEGGKKIGKLTLRLLLNSLLKEKGHLNEVLFEKNLKRFLYPFYQNKYSISSDEITFAIMKPKL